MNKFLKVLACSLLGSTMLFAAACGGNGGGGNGGGTQKYDTESRALALSIGALDGNFNPFFSTSLTDTQVISMTQSSLITSDVDAGNNVKPVAGDNYNTVAKDFEIKFYNASGNECEDMEAADGGTSVYRFLIKNGMKFSDGTPLTIKDVLFNFYVYLDPVYTGSNTMYSVDIQGLKAYQNNDSTIADDATVNTGTYAVNAQNRIQYLINYGRKEDGYRTLGEQNQKDFERVKTLFKQEIETDWNSVETSYTDTFKVNYNFTAAWQAYLFNEGVVVAQYRQYSNGTQREIRVDAKTGVEIDPTNKEAYELGKVLTTLDPWADGAVGGTSGVISRQDILDDIAAATTSQKVSAYMAENSCDEETAILKLTKEYSINKVYSTYLNDDGTGLDVVLTQWATANTAYSEFLADERGKTLDNSAHPQYYIRGIQTEKNVTSFNGKTLDGSYDVLKVIVNEVDPAAIWQFGITIAPMSYYSGTYEGKNYITSFNGDQIDYANDKTGDKDTCFGVCRGKFDFFDQVVRGTVEGKSALPKGAGPYMASTSIGGVATSGSKFYENYIVNYERNPYFETMGSGLNNAKIKYLRYKVLTEDRILDAINTGNIDYGEPNASNTNYTAVMRNRDTLENVLYDTNGYGYVGINPTYVPDINIRKIIMRAMSPGLSLNYYGNDLASQIYRPMSTTSWAYPKGATEYEYLNKHLTNPEEIKAELKALGYTDRGDGVYQKGGKSLTYTFTIAGANSDHPAYNMFQDARELLNSSGFDIKLSTDSNALLALTRGGLQIWAAAWSSGVDPDMYQVYHKNSQATSVLNWGYKTILNDASGDYQTEQGIINNLSDLIDEARSTTMQDVRAGLYNDCLDLIMDLAIELPLYQRKDLCVFNKTIIDSSTVNMNAGANNGVLDRIWEVNYL